MTFVDIDVNIYKYIFLCVFIDTVGLSEQKRLLFKSADRSLAVFFKLIELVKHFCAGSNKI